MKPWLQLQWEVINRRATLDILLSASPLCAHLSSSQVVSPSETPRSCKVCGTRKVFVLRQTYLDITYHPSLCDRQKTASLSPAFFKRSLRSPFPFSVFPSISPPLHPSEHKPKMRSPLSCDNFPWGKHIERYRAVSNLSGKVLERYPRALDVHVLWHVKCDGSYLQFSTTQCFCM